MKMNMNKTAALAAALLLTLTALTGCQKENTSSLPSSTPGSIAAVSVPALPEDESSSDASSVDSSTIPSENPSSSSADSSEVSSEQSSSTGTDKHKEAEFKAAFNKNAIDKAYDDAQSKADDMFALMEISSSFAEIWKDETNIAHKKALKVLTGDALTDYKTSQKAWSDKRESELNRLQREAQEEGGSDAALAYNTSVLEFYRARVYSIYLRIYEATGSLPRLTYNADND